MQNGGKNEDGPVPIKAVSLSIKAVLIIIIQSGGGVPPLAVLGLGSLPVHALFPPLTPLR
jgi:hypothetical protein